jgi:cardiolipin hydrolase
VRKLHGSKSLNLVTLRLRHTIFAAAKKKIKSSKDDELTMVVMDKTHDLIKILELTTLQPVPRLRKALFFPDPHSFDTFYNFIRGARTSLDICVFTITDDRISHLLIEAHRRHVNIRIITDDEKSIDKGADIQDFRKVGIHVRYIIHSSFFEITEWIIPRITCITNSAL